MSKQEVAQGFMLFELIVCLAIVVIIIGLAAGNLSFLNRHLVATETEKLYAACLYMQRLAMVTGHEQQLLFDQKTQSYVYGATQQKLPAGVTFGFIPGIKGPPSSPFAPIRSAITFPDSKISFYPNGLIQAGTVYLSDQNTTCMYALSCPVSQVSYVRRYRYADGWKANA